MTAQTPLSVVDLTLKLCSIESTTGIEGEVGVWLKHYLEALGWHVETQEVGSSERKNILATQSPDSKEGLKILLTSHIDTVPPFYPAEHREDHLFGRGVCDAKGLVASMICAAESLDAATREKVALLFVVGEETNSDGAKKAAQGFAPKVDYFINGEPTDSKLCIATKGALAFELKTQGQAGHSAYPELGPSATHRLIDTLNRLLDRDWHQDPLFGETTLNVGTLEGGLAGNVIAPSASAKLVMRTSKDHNELIHEIEGACQDGSELVVHSASSPMRLTEVSGFETCTVSFGCDIPHLASIGEPLLYGPGSILDAHTSHEVIRIHDLEESVQTYAELCRRLMKGDTA